MSNAATDLGAQVGQDNQTEMSDGWGSNSPAVILTAVASRNSALSAIGALLTWIEHIEGHLVLNSTVRVRWVPLEGTVSIDLATATTLELVHSPMGSPNSLWGTLLATATAARRSGGGRGNAFVGPQNVPASWGTPMTRRLLRTNVLQPLTDTALLESRLTSVEELVWDDERRFELDKALIPLRSDQLDVDALTHRLLTIKKPRVAPSTSGASRASGSSVTGAASLGVYTDDYLPPPDPELTDTRIQLILKLKAWLFHLGSVVEALQCVHSPLLCIVSTVRSGQLNFVPLTTLAF